MILHHFRRKKGNILKQQIVRLLDQERFELDQDIKLHIRTSQKVRQTQIFLKANPLVPTQRPIRSPKRSPSVSVLERPWKMQNFHTVTTCSHNRTN